jgi:hypothetical protein
MNALHPLADDVPHPSPHRDRVAAWKVWCGLLLAPLAFSVQVVASYVIASDLCSANAVPLPYLVAVCVLTSVMCGVGVGLAWTSWRRTRGEASGDMAELAERGNGRTRFMALFGLTGSSLFLFGILLQIAAFALFGPCVGFAGPG